MKQKINILILSAFALLCINHNVGAVVIGSNSAVSRTSSANFSHADTNNALVGFVMVSNGLTLQDALTQCTFDGAFPISGGIVLSGGTLNLSQNLMLSDVVTITSVGSINGNGHVISLPSSLQTLGSSAADSFMIRDAIIQLNSPVAAQSNMVLYGNCVLDGQGNTFDIESVQISVAPNATLTLRNVVLNGLHDSNISCVDDSARLILDNAAWHLVGDFEFINGSFSVISNFKILGNATFAYASALTSSVNRQANLQIKDGVRLLMGKSSFDAAEPLDLSDLTSKLILDKCTIASKDQGFKITKGTVCLVRDVTVEVNSTSTANAMCLGDGLAEHDPIIELYPGSTAIFSKGIFCFDTTTFNLVKSESESARLIRRAGTTYYMNQNIQNKDFSIQAEDGVITEFAPGKSIEYKDCVFSLPIGQFKLSCTQSTNSLFKLDGNKNIFMISGLLPFAVSVSGTNNMITGNGTISYPFSLTTDSQLIWFNSGTVSTNIQLGGGTIALSSDLKFGPDALLQGSGTVYAGSHNVVLGSKDLTWQDQTKWIGSQGGIILNANVALKNNWTFSGDCIINGNGKDIDLADGEIVVAPGSRLVIANANLKNVSANKIRCADDAGILVLDNVMWKQNGDAQFSFGSLQFKNLVEFSGAYTFAYRSNMISTILSEATWHLDKGFTVNYNPQNGATSLIEFENETASLLLSGAKIHAVADLDLTKGSMIVRANSTLESEGINGFTFGSLSHGQDFYVTLVNGMGLYINSGAITYKNIDPTSFNLGNYDSRIYLADGTTFNLYNNFNVGSGILVIGNNVQIGTTLGTSVIGSVAPQGAITYFDL